MNTRESRLAEIVEREIKDRRFSVGTCTTHKIDQAGCAGCALRAEIRAGYYAVAKALGEKVPHIGIDGYHTPFLCPPSWGAHSPKTCAEQGGRCQFGDE